MIAAVGIATRILTNPAILPPIIKANLVARALKPTLPPTS